MAGTLKAVLANAVKTAVLYQKGGFVGSAICPFCEMQVPEDTLHMYEICPRWQHLREAFLAKWDFRRLPWCTRYTGIACLPVSASAEFDRLTAEPHPLHSVRRLIPADLVEPRSHSPSMQPSIVHIWLCVHGINLEHPLWKRWGYGFFSNSNDFGNIQTFHLLTVPDQVSPRAFAVAFVHILKLISQPVHIHVLCQEALSAWQEAQLCHWLPNKADHVDVSTCLRALCMNRFPGDDVIISQSKSPSTNFSTACSLAKQGAALHQTVAYTQAFKWYIEHSECVYTRQNMMLDILLARDQFAQAHKLLTYSPKAKRVPFSQAPGCSNSLPSQDLSPEYLIHPANFTGHCHTLGPFPKYHRQLRFSFGEPFFHALVWYLSQLKFPDTDIESTKGVTLLEPAMDFECASGIYLAGLFQSVPKSRTVPSRDVVLP